MTKTKTMPVYGTMFTPPRSSGWAYWSASRVGIAFGLCLAGLLVAFPLEIIASVSACGLRSAGTTAKETVATADAVSAAAWWGIAGAVTAAAGPALVAFLRRPARWWPWALIAAAVIGFALWKLLPDALGPSDQRVAAYCLQR